MSSKPSPDFGVQRNNRSIIELKPKGTINTGIRYATQIKGVVPFFEEYDAMVEAGFNVIEWENLDYVEKADAIAYRRLKRLIGLHENDAVQRYHERMARRGAMKRPRRRR